MLVMSHLHGFLFERSEDMNTQERQELKKLRSDVTEIRGDLELIYNALQADTEKLRSEMEAAFQLVSKRLKELRQVVAHTTITDAQTGRRSLVANIDGENVIVKEPHVLDLLE